MDQYLLFLCINYALLARDITRSAVRKQLKHDKKLTCRRETARCFVSLNILLSHLWSLKVIENSTIRKLGYGLYSLSIVTMALEHLIDRAIFRLRIIKSYRNLDFKVTPLSDAKYLGNGMIHILTHPTQGCQLE